MNFQMFKLDLGKIEEPEIKLPTSVGSLKRQEFKKKKERKKKQEFHKNIYFDFIDYAKALTVWITTNCGKFKRQEYQTPDLPPEKSVCRSRSNS